MNLAELDGSQRIRDHSLTFGMLDCLGQDIATGKYKGRRFPPEMHLARDFGVSRAVAREVVKMLTAKGLLLVTPRRGIAVLPDTSWNIFDSDVAKWIMSTPLHYKWSPYAVDLLRSIGPGAAGLAAQSATAPALRAIEKAIADMIEAFGSCDYDSKAMIDFHVAVVRASNNPFFTSLCDVVMLTLRTVTKYTDLSDLSIDVDAHRAVGVAIRAGHESIASAKMAGLLRRVFDASNRTSGH